ncbi:class I tRNA ligase family protein, partial [Candidatus Woesearchaeota archaeon]|nr:class I tRNA ligase family protein [Candidatus Woesearchaeota archaeon]
KEKMIEENKKVKWVPNAAFNAFDSWLKNLRDNSITKQRFWGTPLPVWRCEKCGAYDVVESEKELEHLSGKKPKDLHKPWIDEITIPCECGKTKTRIPDILDVWVDAGTVSWNCLDYPQRKDIFKELFPADFILEGKDQIRGWFNLLLITSMLALEKHSYKAVYMHGFVQDSQGRKMSKSLGNYILPEEVVKDYGADTLRYYMIGGANPGIDINYNFDDVKLKHKNMFVFWNLHNFIMDMARNIGKNPEKIDESLAKDAFSIEEKYIISKLNSTIKQVTGLFEEYRLNEVPLRIEELFLELSRTYIQLIRDKAATGTKQEKEAILYTIYTVLTEGLKMFAVVAPFISEQMYQDLKEGFGMKEESIHLFDWPKADEKLISKEVEQKMDIASSVVQSALAAREKVQLGTRWPLKEIIIASKDKEVVEAVESMEDIIKSQTNSKEIKVQESLPQAKASVRADFGTLGPEFGQLTPKIIARLSTESADTIIESLEKKSKFKVKVDGKDIELLRKHLIIKRDVPYPYTEMEFRGGLVYINSERSEELEAEGYAREVMRRVQALRKKAGLEKPDRIVLFIKVDEEMEDMLKKWDKAIAEKCGADKIKVSSKKPAKKHKHHSDEKVKGKEFSIFFDKV